ncbi:hypothetical protein C495_11549 [Natronorubrum sulfidifaciens JCM 14089]|uniref:Zinc-ribbon domain-containing protein n=1 Tax=Natronorubrum sulfidifaciens JCM 14089 TaxID=1230460 RepID=L9W8A7_9EURY|nr:hypothetical protein C495_11549 [Natronorubrum sulfidifaciens JCM 14089]
MIIDWIKQYTDADRHALVHYECRRCGTTLTADDTTCPVCGSDEVATIPL